jgi:cystathionine gamma-synthase
MHPSTTAIHADDPLSPTTDIAPPIHTSTTFAYPRDHTALKPVPVDSDEYLDLSTPLVYSRLTNANVNRLETILAPLVFPAYRIVDGYWEGKGKKEGDEVNGIGSVEMSREMSDVELANHVITYSSGLSAFHAMLMRLNPRVVAIGGGYHGCHGVSPVFTQYLENR